MTNGKLPRAKCILPSVVSRLVVLAVAVPLTSCVSGADPGSEERESNETAPLDIERRITTADTAITNLSSRIDALGGAVESQPQRGSLRAELVGLLLSRSQFLGSFDDLGRALALGQEGLELDPGSQRRKATLARAQGAVHEFDAALSLLEGGDEFEEEPDASSYRLAQGKDPRPIEEVRRKRAEDAPSYASLSDWAIALAATGQFERADRAYERALEQYRDVSPFPIAWVAFQRGVMWAERAGDVERGRIHYQQAARLLPQYSVANVHLAELEAGDDPRRAEERLRFLIDRGSGDPEPYDLLATLVSDEAERNSLIEVATERYRELLARHPKAFLDHGAEFFASTGNDPAYAVELAEENLAHRSDDRSLQVAIEAALAADDDRRACAWAADARELRFGDFERPSIPLRKLAESTRAGCDDD